MSVWDVEATAGGSGDWELPPEGSQPGVVVALVDLGTHHEVLKSGKDAGKQVTAHKCLIVWELTEAPMANLKGFNHTIAQRYTVSLSPSSALTALLKQWGKVLKEGDKFNIRTLLGKPCFVNLLHKPGREAGKVHANFGGVSGVPKSYIAAIGGIEKFPKPKTTPFVFDILKERGAAEDALANLLKLTWFPKHIYGEKIEDLIRNSDEWLALGVVGQRPAQQTAPQPATTPAPTSFRRPPVNDQHSKHDASEFDAPDREEAMAGAAGGEEPF